MSKTKDRLEELERRLGELEGKVNILWDAGYGDEIKLIKKHLGFGHGDPFRVFSLYEPQNTVYDVIQLILDHFDLKVETRSAETKLVKRKKEDKPIIYKTKKMTAKLK